MSLSAFVDVEVPGKLEERRFRAQVELKLSRLSVLTKNNQKYVQVRSR